MSRPDPLRKGRRRCRAEDVAAGRCEGAVVVAESGQGTAVVVGRAADVATGSTKGPLRAPLPSEEEALPVAEGVAARRRSGRAWPEGATTAGEQAGAAAAAARWRSRGRGYRRSGREPRSTASVRSRFEETRERGVRKVRVK